MLQLRTEDALTYEQNELSHINSIIEDYAWDDQKYHTKLIKHKISTYTLRQQNCRCVYCERLLIGLNPQIEHIADKATYKDFSFETLNLATACCYCNGPTNKHNEDTVLVKNANYTKCEFKIVHPYLDNVEENFVYLNNSRFVYDYNKCSEKGKFTIDTLGWDKIQHLYIFAQVQEERSKPLPIDLEELIVEISTYRPKT